jgi:hypothetical protein
MPTSAKLNDDLSSPAAIDTVKTSNLTLNTNLYTWFSSEDFCSSAYNASQSNTFQYVKFKGSDKSIISEQTITVTGGSFSFGYQSSAFGEKDGYLYMQDYTTKNKIWKINLSNVADITSLTLPESVSYLKICKCANGLLFINQQSRNAYYFNGSTFQLVGIMLFNSGTVYYYLRLIPSAFIPAPYILCTKDSNAGITSVPYLSIIAPYLATIDNLASPVTKTANQTMKVIYTITNS